MAAEGAAQPAAAGKVDVSVESGSHTLSDAEYERELEALRKISADATRKLELRQAGRNQAALALSADPEERQRVENPTRVSAYLAGGLDSPWMGSSHGAADE